MRLATPFVCVALLLGAALARPAAGPAPRGPSPASSLEPQAPRPPSPATDAFFSTTKLHTAHLAFTADQWAAMQPRGSGFGGGFGGFGMGGFLGAEGARNGVAARMGVAFDYVRANLELDGKAYRDVAVRYKGNGSYMQGSRE